ncbi:MAG: molybdopterin-synthase adenylyltransferase MoeB [Marinosulfonomonas sp.]|nr:molybdopterin-synthase adenylyltransferase MoeB [Marinosulfonomonas sp.]
MGYILSLAIGLWLVGALIGVSHAKRWFLIGLLYAAVVIAHLVLPDGVPLRAATGGSVGPWLILGGIGAVVVAYRAALGQLRIKAQDRVAQMSETTPKPTFTNVELDRYARHIMLREIGGAGQKKLKNARVLVIGAGGLGSPVLLYLAAAGVGTIGVVDDDVVDNSNLQRQVIHRDADIGMPKVFSAQAAMQAQNPKVVVRPYQRRLDQGNAADLFADYDLVLDGTDNFQTRYLVNHTCVALGKPLIAGALTQWEGQISTYDPAHGAPCYQCIFPEAPAAGLAPSCAEAGVVGPLPGVIGAMMAVEVVKEITGAGDGMRGQLLIYDALYSETRKIKLKRRMDCPVCSGKSV